MFETTLQIQFVSDWHIGSGLGDGAIADAVLNRDAKGIPCLPGSAIKGALREGAWRLASYQEDLEAMPDFLFGTNSQARVSNRPGLLIVGQGKLDNSLRQWLEAQDDFKEFIEDMTIIRMQTRLDARKMVVPHSLRSIECGIPGLTFSSDIAAALPEDAHAWFAGYLGAICACVKSIGGYRSRGIGRCRLMPGGKKGGELPGPVPASLLSLMKSGGKNENS